MLYLQLNDMFTSYSQTYSTENLHNIKHPNTIGLKKKSQLEMFRS